MLYIYNHDLVCQYYMRNIISLNANPWLYGAQIFSAHDYNYQNQCKTVHCTLPPLNPNICSPNQPKLVEALFGKARFLLMRHNFTLSLDVLNRAVATFPRFLPALIEKMRILLALQDWEQTIETAHRYIQCSI